MMFTLIMKYQKNNEKRIMEKGVKMGIGSNPKRKYDVFSLL